MGCQSPVNSKLLRVRPCFKKYLEKPEAREVPISELPLMQSRTARAQVHGHREAGKGKEEAHV